MVSVLQPSQNNPQIPKSDQILCPKLLQWYEYPWHTGSGDLEPSNHG